MNKLQTNVSQPLNIQLYNRIKESIKKKEYKVGDKIPSEDKLCSMYGVSRITVRAAISHLVDDKILIKRHGKGTFVAMPTYVEKMSSSGSFTKSCIENNTIPSTDVISISRDKADGKIAVYLGVERDKEIICIKRVRSVDKIKAILEIDYFLEEFGFLFKSDVENVPLAEIIEENTCLSAMKFENYFSVYHASKEMATLLECPTGYPLLCIDQVVLDKENKIIYYNRQFIVSERYTCTFTMLKDA